MFKVSYIVKKSGVVITREFDSPYHARQLVNKLKRSKTCVLVSYPNI